MARVADMACCQLRLDSSKNRELQDRAFTVMPKTDALFRFGETDHARGPSVTKITGNVTGGLILASLSCMPCNGKLTRVRVHDLTELDSGSWFREIAGRCSSA